jgi:hypothetical protein
MSERFRNLKKFQSTGIVERCYAGEVKRASCNLVPELL